jgi:hypothetical protein
MPGEQYRHIFLTTPPRTHGFTTPSTRGSPSNFPPRDPARHGPYIQRRLETVWKEADDRMAVLHVDRQGSYIDFVSEPGFDLALQSLDIRKVGIRLLNVRKEENAGKTCTLATVYVPHTKRTHFLKKLNAYTNERTDSAKPKNSPLVNSTSDIRLSVLESFWQDDKKLLPHDKPVWVEVWLSSHDDKVIARFRGVLQHLRIQILPDQLTFPERTVLMIQADRGLLQKIIETSDDVAELRLAKEVATFFVQLANRDQVARVRELLARTDHNPNANVVVCILDSGVNNGHLLLQPVLADADRHTVNGVWGSNDDDGHGTLMAGTAVYGDLLAVLNSADRVRVPHRLESARILPKDPGRNPPHLWGDLTARGISLAEIQSPKRKRIVCLAVTATDFRDRGRPSSWSGRLDEITSGYEDNAKRLILVSAGNLNDPDAWKRYPDDNKTSEVHDPGQSWNALTVGAYTSKFHITHPTMHGWVPIAPCEGLSPYSTTSLTWPTRKWPIKPEVVFEGGNVARGPNNSILNHDDLQVLSTSHRPHEDQFAPFNATSAAAAQAAWMAAQIQVRYPEMWPETVRALLVHTAEWTATLRRQFLADESKTSYEKLLRMCGYGVPDLERALYCARNSLTLISQVELQPYDRKDNRYVSRDMHLYSLPWPKDALLSLGATQVDMRVTLSYFVEPGPGEIGWENRYRYASHALRFDVNGPTESDKEFLQRVNAQAREDGEPPGTSGPTDKWVIGKARNVGSIHSDIWRGTAAELAESNKVAVYPAIGWWRERAYLGRWNKKCRYSLVISIHTPPQTVDIYTPVAIAVGIAIPTAIPIPQPGERPRGQ